MSELPEKILNITFLQDKLHTITVESVKLFLLHTDEVNDLGLNWNYLLLCASILAQSDKARCQDAALRIAQYCLCSNFTTESQKLSAIVVLSILTNNISIKLAIKRGFISEQYIDKLPFPIQLDLINLGIKHGIYDDGRGTYISINQFQKKVLQGVEEYESVSISAPTSAGKSYILNQIVNRYFQENDKAVVVYLVPSRALIHQVELDISQEFSKQKHNKVYVTSIPELPANWEESSILFVYTQERLQWLLADAPEDFKIGLIIVDEAHKIQDGARGVLLQQILEDVTSINPLTKIYFSSPLTSNPEIFFDLIPKVNQKKTVSSEYVSVNQNLIFVSQVVRKPLLYSVELISSGKREKVGEVSLPFRASPESKKLPFISHVLGDKEGGNLIYCNGPADAEEGALQLYELMSALNSNSELETNNDSDINELIKFTKDHIHKDYNLIKVLQRGIAFHYGNMPLLIREEIERLFSLNKIKYLFCTSTLLEGVNLPAKSIFIRGPRKGAGHPMNEFDFWNLAGRAGRSGKEFQGNVICIDPDDESVWLTPPPLIKATYPVTRSINKIVEQGDDLLDYIKQGAPRNIALKSPHLESGFVYFYKYFKEHGSLDSIGYLTNDLKRELTHQLELIDNNLQLPYEVIKQSPGISPLAQEAVLNYFNNYTGKPEDLIPAYPEERNAVADSYKPIIEKICELLSGDNIQLAWTYAIITVQWIKGLPLGYIIKLNLEYWKTRDSSKKLPSLIRDTLKYVEEFSRFKFAKYSACYINVLKHFFLINNRKDLIDNIPKLHIWLEFGASLNTQIALMGLGLSRNTAIELSRLIADDNLDREGCIKWLQSQENNIDALDLSNIILVEVKKILNSIV